MMATKVTCRPCGRGMRISMGLECDVACPGCDQIVCDDCWSPDRQDCPACAPGEPEEKTDMTPTSNPAIAHVLQFFAYAHLPPHLQEVSRHFFDLAERVGSWSSNPETTVALRKLLEAKDAAVRAMLVGA